MSTTSDRPPRAQLLRACAIGGGLAFVVFVYVALEGRPNPFAGEVLANFYEVQARSLLHGHWDVPAGSLLFERFKIGGEFHTYFGPWPALLRLPFVLFTDQLDGRLSRVSMIGAFSVMLVYVSRLTWQVRTLVVGDRTITRGTLLAAGGFVFAAGCGSTALFLGSWTAVYHEAILWGVAWAIASYSYLASYLTDPTRRSLVLAGATATFAYLSRTSVGLGPVLALAIILVVSLVLRARAALRARKDPGTGRDGEPRWVRWLGIPSSVLSQPVRPLAIATIVPIALGAYVNWARFGSLFGLPPYDKQDLLALRPHRQAALDASGGSLFGLEFFPTTVLQYLRPDAIGFDRLFPWVTFSGRPNVIGDAVFESIDFTASITITSLLLVALGIVGVVMLVRRSAADASEPSSVLLRVPAFTALAGCAGALVLAFLEERYAGDFVPLLVLAALVGLWAIQRAATERSPRARTAIAAILVVLAAWSCWATTALALQYQRAYAPVVTREARADFVDFGLSLHSTVPGGAPSRVEQGSLESRPRRGEPGDLYIADDCDGLYWSNGREWHPLEQTPATGGFALRVRLVDREPDTLEPLLVATDDRGSSILWIRHLGPATIRFEYEWTGDPQFPETGAATPDAKVIGQAESDPIVVDASGQLRLDVRFDTEGYVGVRSGDDQLMSTFAPVADAPAHLGRQDITEDGNSRFSGNVQELPIATPVCDALLSDMRQR